MSRGRWRGRGSTHSFLKRQRIGGQEESWDHDPSFLIDSKPRGFFPELEIPKPPAPSQKERAAHKYFQNVRRRIRDGPLYTVFDVSSHSTSTRIAKHPQAKKSAAFNPFDDVPTYTQKYRAPSRALPRFDTRRYNPTLFPKELRDIVRPNHARHRTTRSDALRRHRPFTTRGRRQTGDEADEEEAKVGRGDEADIEVVDRDDDDDDDNVRAADDGTASESNPEDDFADNDSDMAGDYNAQGYYEMGDDENDGMDGDGGDDGGFD